MEDTEIGNGRPTSPYNYSPSPMGTPRPMRIVVIGAGISGIAAVKLFRDQFVNQSVELVVYEKNKDVGGTWLENRYPGCACDVPAHMYTYTWEGNPSWSKVYVGSAELFAFFKGRAIAYGVDEFLRLEHQVTEATWIDQLGKWRVKVLNKKTGTYSYDETDVLINAAGFLNNWIWPKIPGLDTFQGQLIHSADWQDNYDFGDKTIAVIGSGSSAIQIVPQLQPKVKHLTSFNRSKTWITSEFGQEFAPEGRRTEFSEEQKKIWAEDPNAFFQYRKRVEANMNESFNWGFKTAEEQRDLLEQSKNLMKGRLGGRKDLENILIPDFAVGCRRLTPGHGYLEALSSNNVSVRTDEISEVVADGIKMKDNTIIPLDCIVCATGFDTSYRPAFPLLGKKGKDLRTEWATNPRSYLSIAAQDFPNYFIIAGPNFPIANGSLIPSIEATIKYAFKAVAKMQREGIKCMVPKKAAIDDFQEHKDSLMRDLVWTSGCNSWYKDGQGAVWGPWCGSSLHFLELMSECRWEDWEFEGLSGNRFQYLGNGKTQREERKTDLAYYLT